MREACHAGGEGGEAVQGTWPDSTLTFSYFQRALGLAKLLYCFQELFPPSLFQGLTCEGNNGNPLWLLFSVINYTDRVLLGLKKMLRK